MLEYRTGKVCLYKIYCLQFALHNFASPIHDHSNSHCFMKILDGTLEETHYYWPKEGESQAIREKECFLHSKDDVTYIEGK